jgi:hypothetical protein
MAQPPDSIPPWPMIPILTFSITISWFLIL